MPLASWLGASVYFILIDRFQNGDRSRDDFGKGEYSPDDDDCFQGGDLAGIRERLPYIKKLGFSAIWLTPPVYNQWIDPTVKGRGYHGYWAYDFTQVDPHFGTLDDYKALVAEAHALGLRVIQDVVVNHTGNYFTVSPDAYDPRRPERSWRPVAGAYPPEGLPKAPNDPVFRMNNPNVAEHRKAAVYNFTPSISDFNDRRQTLTWSLGDLDDINLDSPLALARLKEIYRYWIEQAGVDGLRIDTVYHTPERFYERFLYDAGPGAPGLKVFARARGISGFFVFGEVWSYDYETIGRYLRPGRRPRLDSAIDVPLNEALGQVFLRKAATELLRPALSAPRRQRRLWINYLDSHDVERLAARAGQGAIEQALVALFTLPEIPCLTYGTEAGLTQPRQNMFAKRHFTGRSRRYRLIRELLALRRRRPAFSRGRASVETDSSSCGALAYVIAQGGARYRVIFNTASSSVVYDFGEGKSRLVKGSCRLRPRGVRLLPPESWLIVRDLAAPRRRTASVALARPRAELRGSCELRFSRRHGPPPSRLWLLVDDDYERRVEVPEPAAGRFAFDAGLLGNGRRRLRLLAREAGRLRLSPPVDVVAASPYRFLAEAPGSHRHRRLGLQAPAEASFGGQMCIKRASVSTSGRDLRLLLEMEDVTRTWNPPNGYDHVYFSVFFDLPGRKGASFLPKLGASRPGFSFCAGFLLHGWGARSFGAEGSTPESYGPPVAGEVEQLTDPRRRTIAFTFSDKVFPPSAGWRGAKVLVCTWDGYLGELRPISRRREDWAFQQRNSRGAPKIYDEALLSL